ncbi:carbonic anhydrase [Undibacterium curvum]|uniref:carbonic anhydrase n=1 Tax=Undibacterium curvum TaxID=2762294 RepID=A0ABR7A984_9BURK|nr:carbonic anhydrase family protein [Undibacterium curvum]MBC3933439.1 carbonic anhydrase family protein [Undibacterium curvum]
MRRYPALLLTLLLASFAHANDGPASSPSKPIKQASAKEDSASEKKESKKSSKDKEKDSKETAAKEALQADELAAKIAERLAVLRKEKEREEAPKARPVVRSYVPPVVKKAEPKKEAEHGTAAIVAAMGGHGALHWGYQGEGSPLNWGKMNPANAKCDNGDRQSPIDIRDGIKVDLDPINFDYKLSGFNVIDNGHTIQVNIAAGNFITVMGRSYELMQFHFHKPSEERINGKSFEMVVHLVHKDADGKLAVVAVLIERGKAHALVQLVWNNLPLEKNEAVSALSAMDLSNILPLKRGYYTYMGSLTTPPCSEGVLWMVMKEPIELSAEQIGIFHRLYPMNARPVQKGFGRMIKESS